MSRKKTQPKKNVVPDPKFNSTIIQKLIKANDLTITIENNFAMLASFFFSLLAIKYFLKYLQKFNMFIFVIYRLILGIVLIFFFT